MIFLREIPAFRNSARLSLTSFLNCRLVTRSESASEERKRILKAYGAQIRLPPGYQGTDGAIEEAYRLAREEPAKYFLVDQFNNDANWQAHYDGTGKEIWEATGGRVDVVVLTMGTTGTLMGVTRVLKELNPAIRVVGVEPFKGHKIQGLKNMSEAMVAVVGKEERSDSAAEIGEAAGGPRLLDAAGNLRRLLAEHISQLQARQFSRATVRMVRYGGRAWLDWLEQAWQVRHAAALHSRDVRFTRCPRAVYSIRFDVPMLPTTA